MSHLQNVAIVGAGLAGPTLALFLKKQGVSSTIYEARPISYQRGGAIMIASNGLRVLDHLGLYENIRLKGGQLEKIIFTNPSGKQVAVGWQGHKEAYGYPAIRLQRSILREELIRQCKEQGIPVLYEKTLSSIKEHGEKITLSFSDGESAEASLLIGADGIRSAVRKHIIPNCNPYYCGLYVIYGMMKKDAIRNRIKGLQEPAKVFGVIGKEGSLLMVPTDYAGEECAYFFNLSLPDRSAEDWASLRNDKEKLRDLLISQYCGKGWPEIVEVFCRDTPAEELHSWAVSILPNIPSWKSSSGRVILIGDAAHAIPPAAGQGGCISLEDAESLAYALGSSLDMPSLGSALEKWETHRKARYQQVLDYTHFVMRLRAPAPYWILQQVKEWTIWAITKYRGVEGYRWLYGYDAVDFKSKL